MKTTNVPRLDARYWVSISLASVFGANLGDFFARVLDLGHWRGLPVLAVIFLAIVVAERLSRPRSEVYFWAAIVTLRTAATNLGDLGAQDLHLASGLYLALLAIALAALAIVIQQRDAPQRDGRQQDAHTQGGRAGERSSPRTTSLYWVTMLVAGTLGTVLGDVCAGVIGLAPSTLAWLVIWSVAIALALRGAWTGAVGYWTTIAIVRTFGTNAGDLLVSRRGAGLGLELGTALSGLVFVAVVTAWRSAEAQGAAVRRGA